MLVSKEGEAVCEDWVKGVDLMVVNGSRTSVCYCAVVHIVKFVFDRYTLQNRMLNSGNLPSLIKHC